MLRSGFLAALFLLGACTSTPPVAKEHAHGAPVATASGAGVRLSGPSGEVRTLSAAEIAELPHISVTANFHEKTYAFEGVRLTDLLSKIGAPSGEKLSGANLDHVIIVTARDGYRVALSLAETDAAIRASRTILADKVDGGAIPDADGPLRLVVEGDLKPARSARMVASIEVRRLD